MYAQFPMLYVFNTRAIVYAPDLPKSNLFTESYMCHSILKHHLKLLCHIILLKESENFKENLRFMYRTINNKSILNGNL